MPPNLTARLIADLPETMWTEAVRRLQRVPELGVMAENAEMRGAFVTHARAPRRAGTSTSKAARLGAVDTSSQVPNWRPGPLALQAYAVRHPACQGQAEAWLLGAGRERLGTAYTRLATSNDALDALDDALPAAMALRLRMAATSDWYGLAAEAAAAPERWRLPLQYLWGLWPGGHGAIFNALLTAGAAGAALAAQCAAVNLAPDELVEFVAQQGLNLPAAQWLAFSKALDELGEHESARAILRPHVEVLAARAAKSGPPAWNPLELNLTIELERSLLAAATDDFALAHPVLAAAWTQLRQLRAVVAGHIGRLALQADDLVTAQAGYLDAYTERPEDPAYRTGLADVLTKLGRPDEALTLLVGVNHASVHLSAARAHFALGQLEQAREALAAVVAADGAPPAILASASRLQAEVGDVDHAAHTMQRAARAAGTESGMFLQAAQWLLERAQPEEACQMATEAAALAPNAAEARETLGRSLLACQRPVEAIPHFQAAAALEPKCHSALIGLARAALAANIPEQAVAAADKVLTALANAPSKDTRHAGIAGQAHTLAGQALSVLDREDDAFEHFRRATTLVPSAPEPWRAIARHHQRQSDPAQALATLEAGRQALAVLQSSEAAPLLGDLADLYVAAGRPTEAILALREACKADPGAQAEHQHLGKLLRRQGSVAEAVDVLRHALELKPGDGTTLYELAQALEHLGQLDEAWSALQQATLTRPVDADPYIDLGRLTLVQLRKANTTASPLQAIAALRSGIDRDGNRAESHGLLAQAQQLAGDAHGALESYQRALHLAPMRTDWSLGLGQVCLELQHPEISVAALQGALEHAPEHPGVHAALAEAYAQSKLWPEARRAAEAARQLDPNDPHYAQLSAEAAAHLGDETGALQSWREAVDLNPADVLMRIRLAHALLDSGSADGARAEFAQAIETSPGSPDAHLAAGQAFLRLGEVDQAFTLLSRAVELAPHSAEVQAAFGQVAMQAHKLEAAHAAYLQAADLDSGRGRPGYLREAGEALWSMNRLSAGVALWQKAVALDPNDQALRARLGMALLQLKQYPEALQTLEQAAAQNPRDALIAREAARAAFHLDRVDVAANYLQTAVVLNPGDAEARYMFGQVRERQGQPEAALQFYRQAARVDPSEGRYLAAAAQVLDASGKRAEALDVMHSALQLTPDSAEVNNAAGELYLRAKRPYQAVRAFQQCASARPRDPGLHLALARALVMAAQETERSDRVGLPVLPAERLENIHSRIVAATEQASALGGNGQAVRYWLGRGHAAAGDPGEAQRLLETVVAVKAAPDAPLPQGGLYRSLGAALRRSGQLGQSIEALQAALLHDDGETADTCLELGLTHLALGDASAAAAAFRRAIAATPEWPIAHYHLAESLATLGEANEAALVLLRALALRPDTAAWHYRLAGLHSRISEAGDLESQAAALGHYQRAAELEPTNAHYTADLARALARDGDLAAAARRYLQATAANSQDGNLWTEQGHTQLALGDLPAAASSFAHALAIAPANASALLGGARVSLQLDNLADAQTKAEAAVRATPNDPAALMCLADVDRARGDAAGAERCYTAAAAKAANPATALLALGQLYASHQKWDHALQALERAAAAEPASDEIQASIGAVQAAAGNPGAAVKAYREAAHIAPRQARHLLGLGRACRAQGQLDQALSHLMQARDLAPTDDEILREIGLVFDQRKQFDRALEMYRLAIEAAPAASANYTRAGIALKNMKSYGDAVHALEQAVALDSKNVEATKQLAVVSAMSLVQSPSQLQQTVSVQ